MEITWSHGWYSQHAHIQIKPIHTHTPVWGRKVLMQRITIQPLLEKGCVLQFSMFQSMSFLATRWVMSSMKPTDIHWESREIGFWISSLKLYMRYKMAEMGEPCGRPSVISNLQDRKSSRCREVILSVRKLKISCTRYFGDSFICMVFNSLLWWTEGYVDFMSKNMPDTIIPFRHLSPIHEVSGTKVLPVLCCQHPSAWPLARMWCVSAQKVICCVSRGSKTLLRQLSRAIGR